MHDIEGLLEHRSFLRGLARSLVLPGEDPEDAVQETWASALRHPPGSGVPARGWLATVLRNALRQARRAGRRREAREVRAALPEAVPSDVEIREREALRHGVVEEVLALDPIHRDVLVLLFLEELPPREAAARLGVPVETVKSRRKRALSAMREALDRRHGGDRGRWIGLLVPMAGVPGGSVGGSTDGGAVRGAGRPAIPGLVGAAAGAVLLAAAGWGLLSGAPGWNGLPGWGTAGGDPLPLATVSPPRAGKGQILVRGSVRTPAGAPLEGVLLTLGGEPGSASGPDGEFVLGPWPAGRAGVVPGVVRSVARSFAHSVDHAMGHEGPRVTGSFKPGTEDPRVDLVLDPGGAGAVLLVPRFRGEAPEEARFTVSTGGFTLGFRFDGRRTGSLLLLAGDGEAQPLEAELQARGWFPGRASTGIPPAGTTVRLEVEASTRGPSSGRVTNAAGRPVAGARIWSADDPRFPDDDRAAVADDEGRFELTPDLVGKSLLADGGAAGLSPWVRPSAGEEDLSLVLAEGCVVEGRVVDEGTGEPVAGAVVQLEFGVLDHEVRPRAVLADAEGRFRFDSLPTRSVLRPKVDLQFRASPGVRVDDGEMSREELLRARLEAGEVAAFAAPGARWERDLPVRRHPGVEALCRVRFPAGFPVPPKVTLAQSWIGTSSSVSVTREAILDPARPEWRLFLPAGENWATVSVPGMRGRLAVDPVAGDGPERILEVAVLPLPPVVVRLVDEGGAPLRRAGVRVKVPISDRPWVSADGNFGTSGWSFPGWRDTDAEGRADFTDILPAADEEWVGERVICFLLSGPDVLETDVDLPSLRLPGADYLRRLHAGGAAGLVLDVPLLPWRDAFFRVEDREGRPVAGVELRPENPGWLEEIFKESSWRTDGDGRVRLRFLSVHDLRTSERLVAAPPWRGDLYLSRVLDEQGRGGEAVLRVHRLVPHLIRVEDGAGRPVEGAETADADLRGVFRSDAGGNLRIEIPDRENGFSLRVKKEGFLAGTAKCAPGSTETRLVLERGRRSTVRIAVPEGVDPHHVEVDVHDLVSGARRNNISVSGGMARDPGFVSTDFDLPATGARLVGRAGGGEWRGEVLAAGDEETISIVLDRRERIPVPLLLLDFEGRPRARFPFGVSYHAGGPADSVKAETDGEGRAVVGLYLERGGWAFFHEREFLAWGFPESLDAAPAEPLRLMVEPVRRITVLVDGLEKGAPWPEGAALSCVRDGYPPVPRWARSSKNEGPGCRFDLDLPASPVTLRVAREGRSLDTVVPEGAEGPVILRIP